MSPVLSSLVVAMLLCNDVWEVYGVAVGSESLCMTCISEFSGSIVSRMMRNATMAPFETPSALSRPLSLASPPPLLTTASFASSTGGSTLPNSISTTLAVAVASSTAPSATAKPNHELPTSAKIGIGAVVGVLGLALFLVAFEACYLRRRRRTRALERAVEEVERGMDKGSEERIVLESRVSIVFEDDGHEEEEQERGRNGMSLPRRL
ncbi:hypothetical protein BU26DRAFT_499703 [Trematosphaeria pertusa]|uniref:Uncharacterized protein n=1 Tax=Trematosphaeria pertusa TaxID=390896 RepID=A0A6A6J3E8_9PLEO|nr:uncharacterized protein BU26DRAFT_499703 [Trematosphaeria pertusa]KAF2257156.1 hypothetical protein BU26DRAFT_499703 [Trematosphaeria pertusa]